MYLLLSAMAPIHENLGGGVKIFFRFLCEHNKKGIFQNMDLFIFGL